MNHSEPMKILLIECNPFQPEHTPISLGYLAAYAKKYKAAAEIINLGSNTQMSTQRFTNYLLEYRPDIIGFSCYQRNVFIVNGWAHLCKTLLPNCKVILGGPQATFMPTTALHEMPAIDFICRAEGEAAIKELIIRGKGGDDSAGVPGWSGRGPDASLWDGLPLEACIDLDNYPSPYLDGTLDVRQMDEAILLASRGCPYRCSFCYTPQAFGKNIRYHSLERVVDEIMWIYRNGLRRFWFADPNFTFQTERIHHFLDELLRKDLKPQIWLETRADLVNQALLKKMKRAGVHTIAYGLESASEHVLKKIRKPLVLEQVSRAIQLTQEAGLEVELFSQYGLPGETLEDAKKTLDFVKNNNVKIQGNTNAQQMQIYFGTEIQNEHDRFGIKPFEEASPLYLSIGSRYRTDGMNLHALESIGRLWKASSQDGGKHTVS